MNRRDLFKSILVAPLVAAIRPTPVTALVSGQAPTPIPYDSGFMPAGYDIVASGHFENVVSAVKR